MFFTLNRQKKIVYGVVGTGQSLSVGARAGNVPYSPILTSAGAKHFMLRGLQSPVSPYYSDPDSWSLETLEEPMREDVSNTLWPYNVSYQSPSVGIAQRLNELVPGVRASYTQVGHDGQPMAGIKKGGNVPSYAGSILEVAEFKDRFQTLGFKFRVVAVTLTHGESDLGSATYYDEVLQMHADYNADILQITGQPESIPILFTQPSAGWPQPPMGEVNNICQVLRELHEDHPDKFVLVGSKCNLQYFPNDIHLAAQGTVNLGRMYGEAIARIIKKQSRFEPLRPLSFSRVGNIVHVTLNRAPVLDAAFGPFHAGTYGSNWENGFGFEAKNAVLAPVEISNVSTSGNVVSVTCASVPNYLYFAMHGDGANTFRRAGVRDENGNWLIQFEEQV